ncbi:hypothetical protein CC77DRAFT_1091402 [Alternaria alternata]|uniref:Uncharacterized protein n=1 Tax=Alternaria alternata TaxID=5599 RepID=A0A177DXR9_ALTAL|nr:hypothetical protein CC77DRAFT_1091402 [Alternaria alternata]OAG24457.1 hypothetical protein CC77DRAFT_1091402 [Alternaria alternata]
MAMNVTYAHQTARQRLSTSRTSRRSLASPYPSPTPQPARPTQSQDPPICEVFATLIFDRQRAYQSGLCAPPAPLLAPVTRAEMTAKQTPTRNAGKATTDTLKKRAVPVRLTRATAKRQKTEPNSKQKFSYEGNMGNGISTASTTKPNKDTEIITISDSEDDKLHPVRKGRFSAPKINIHEDEDDVKPSIASLTPNPESNDKQEKEQLRKELDAAKLELDKIKELHEKDKDDSELIRVQSSNATKQATERLQQELETERSNLRAITRYRDQQRIEIDNIRARNDQLATELQEERRLREAERREHENIMEDVMKAKEPTSDAAKDLLITENGRLRTENETLRAAATGPPPMSRPAFPPAPPSIFTPPSSQLSQSSSYPSIFISQAVSPAPSSPTPFAPAVPTQERKEENVRKVYLRVKNQFDNLQLAASNLMKCTRGMELSNFGQFGKYLRQLKTVLEEDAK